MRIRCTLGLLAVVAVAAAGCVSGTGSSSPAASDVPVLQIPTDPGSLDPQASVGAWGRPMLRLAYDTLVADGPNGTVVPQLAQSWTANATQVTFKLKSGITCADGEPFTAKTAAANFERMKDPAAKIPFTVSFLGSDTYQVSSDPTANTVTLKLPKPFSPLLSGLANYPGMICQKGLDNPGELRSKTFGTGPFVLTKSTAGTEYQFTTRKGYSWGPDGANTSVSGFPKGVTVKVVDNETTAANLMLSGALDLGVFTTRGAYQRLTGSKFSQQTVPASATYLHFNFLKPENPAQDIGVRRALSETVDRAAMSKIATGSEKQTHNSVALPQAPCAKDISDQNLIQFDPQKAAQDLASAGWVKHGSGWMKSGRELRLNVLVTGSASVGSKPIADYVVNAWKQLGVPVSIEDVDQATGVERRAENKYDVWVGAWTSVFNPAIIAPFLTPQNSANYGYIANKAYAALAQQAFAMDPSKTCEVWAQAQNAINEQVSMVPLYYDATTYVTSKGLSLKPYRTWIAPTSMRVG